MKSRGFDRQKIRKNQQESGKWEMGSSEQAYVCYVMRDTGACVKDRHRLGSNTMIASSSAFTSLTYKMMKKWTLGKI